MRHADIRTTMNIYGDVVTDEMSVACGKVTRLALNGRGNGREGERNPNCFGGSVCESNWHASVFSAL